MPEDKQNPGKKDKKTEGFKHTQVTQYGTIRVEEEVVAGIAAYTVAEIDGVAEMVGGMTDGITEMLGKKSPTKGVKVEYTEDRLSVDVNILVRYGFQIPVLARTIQQLVVERINEMLGLEVEGVNVYVQGLVFKENLQTSLSREE